MEWKEKEKQLDEQLKYIHERIIAAKDAQDIQRLVDAEKNVLKMSERHFND